MDQVGHIANRAGQEIGEALGLGEADQNKRDDQQRVNDEKAKWDADRAIVNTEWTGLLGEYGSDQFAGRVITVKDPFETMSHQEIYDAIKDVDPAAINTKADGWRNLTRTLAMRSRHSPKASKKTSPTTGTANPARPQSKALARSRPRSRQSQPASR
ncbi:hypothetical protein [Nocardia cyriacigeorgica]|uniref:hypothetical protein n=1 Tax=Nocardia cyriacigeorgica TaxID=135487 RepID=UPI0024577E2D|nr:hypothetical protein [Nocardia cyriacigeorgica]